MAETVIVQIAQGSLKGQKVKTRSGTPYYSFHAIPYAKPPVGPLRFKAPEPAEPWEGVRDALKEGAMAPQVNIFNQKEFLAEEDCLFLNVFTPKLPDTHNTNTLKPIMVYIHGGGFVIGTGNAIMHGPGLLMNTGEVVLVTINYRLGALGFLSTGDSVVPGNNGLKDQVMALRWVQQNIAQFGGDPNNVTIGGVSAGGASAHLLYVSPMAKGLFHRVIASSGCALCPWAEEDPSSARKKAFKVGEALGCHTSNSEELLQFLMKVPAQKFVQIADKLLPEEERHPLPIVYKPVIENENQREEAFLLQRPIDIIKEGKFNQVPFIIGVCSREGLMISGDYKQNESWYHSLTDNLETLIAANLKIENGTEKTQEISKKVKEFYFKHKPVSEETLPNLVDLFGDLLFNIWTYRSAKEVQGKTVSPLYLYQFSFVIDCGEVPLGLLVDIGVPGATHGSDAFLLFESVFLKTQYQDDEEKMSSRMLKMWTNFAKTGNPTPEEDPLLGVTWKPVTETEFNYLDIDKELSMQKDLMKERMDFWDDILRCQQ